MKSFVPWAISLILISASLACNQQKKADQQAIPVKKEKKKKVTNVSASQKKTTKVKFVRLSNTNLEKELTLYGQINKETIVLLRTPKGNMKIKLYENTPLHRANFIRLIKNNFYRETMFYRVIDDFMIQGGDNDDWERQGIKSKMGDYSIPPEFRQSNIHQKGALSMVRDYEDNPELRSVRFDFFIVQGTKYSQGELLGAEQEYGLKIAEKHKETYRTIGGTPHLDGQHTVFGQVIEGLDIIDSIAKVKVDEGDWPIEDITLDFEILN